MNLSRTLSTSVIALALSVPLVLMARSGNELAATSQVDQATTSKLVYGLLSDSRYAYRPRALDGTLSADVFERYLESLDGSKMFFTAADVARFAKFKDHMGGAIKAGELDPAFAIFALFKERVAQRVDYARSLLDQDIFDFTGNDRWYYDREDAPWAASEAEIEQLWKQSVRNDWLRLKLAGK